jgi:hypothetical protein
LKVEIRKPTEEDLGRFKVCLSADPDHAGQDPDEWLAGPSEMLVFYDTKGNRVWMRIERVLRVSLQHDQQVSKRSTASILYQAFRWLAGSARRSFYTEIVFESRAKRLIHFLQRLFGIKPLEENFHLRTL